MQFLCFFCHKKRLPDPCEGYYWEGAVLHNYFFVCCATQMNSLNSIVESSLTHSRSRLKGFFRITEYNEWGERFDKHLYSMWTRLSTRWITTWTAHIFNNHFILLTVQAIENHPGGRLGFFSPNCNLHEINGGALTFDNHEICFFGFHTILGRKFYPPPAISKSWYLKFSKFYTPPMNGHLENIFAPDLNNSDVSLNATVLNVLHKCI